MQASEIHYQLDNIPLFSSRNTFKIITKENKNQLINKNKNIFEKRFMVKNIFCDYYNLIQVEHYLNSFEGSEVVPKHFDWILGCQSGRLECL